MPARLAALLGLALILAIPGQAGHVEDASGGEVAYQFDAGNHHDAPDRCTDASSAWSLAMGTHTFGMVVPGEDPADHIVVDIAPGMVGTRVRVAVVEAAGSPNVDLNVFAPSCEGDVFDPANLPFPLPTPPLPSVGEVQVQPENVGGSHGCAGDGWTLLLTQLQGMAIPASIHLAWTDGTESPALLDGSGGGAAWYTAQQGLNVTLKGAWANLPAEWAGQFRILFGPCNAQDGGAVYGEPPVLGDDTVTFTPVRAGLHVIQAVAAEPEQTSPPSSMAAPASCHYCLGPSGEQATRNMSYRLSAVQV